MQLLILPLALITFFAGFTQGLSGFGSILVSLPLLALFLDIKTVIPLVSLFALVINTIIIYGLATDYCVKATAMDAVKSGFSVILIENLCRGVDQNTSLAALKEMSEAGIKIVPSLSKIIENKN